MFDKLWPHLSGVLRQFERRLKDWLHASLEQLFDNTPHDIRDYSASMLKYSMRECDYIIVFSEFSTTCTVQDVYVEFVKALIETVQELKKCVFHSEVRDKRQFSSVPPPAMLWNVANLSDWCFYDRAGSVQRQDSLVMSSLILIS